MTELTSPDEQLDTIYTSIAESLDSTSTSLEKLKQLITVEQTPSEYPQLIKQLLQELGQDLPEGVSLLSLKNSSMLSYLNNLILVILSNIERLTGEDDEDLKEKRERVIKNTIIQRVTLERGVKGLENRLNYQLDKMTRAYIRTMEEETKVTEKASTKQTQEGETSDEDSDEEEEDLKSFKPDASSLMASLQKQKKTSSKSAESDRPGSGEKYKPPRITPQLPPAAAIIDPDRQPKSSSKTKKLQSMEEYLTEQGDAPQVVESIGSTILNHGRGGIKTSREKNKEQELQRYEEDNFIRLNAANLPDSGKKKTKRSRQDPNVLGGEDFSMFNSKHSQENFDDASSRKRKAATAWDRAKRKR